ncbi:MAG: MerR family transcriptional regulator [Actinomycetota bacterium]
MNEVMTIGELARRAGVTTKTVRHYSNEGLLPPSQTSEAGYRLYAQDDLERLALIRALREAGLDLTAIRSVLDRKLPLREALTLRLLAIEAHVASLSRVGAAIRAALKAGPDEDDLRRLAMVTNQTDEGRKRVIERFFADVYDGLPVDQGMTDSLIEASTPRLPDEPTRAQLDAWIELSEIVSDPRFIGWKRGVSEAWVATVIDVASERTASEQATTSARKAIERGIGPDSAEAQQIVEGFLAASASARGRELDDGFRAELQQASEKYDPRELRYWELVGIINEGHVDVQTEESLWLQEAIRHSVSR